MKMTLIIMLVMMMMMTMTIDGLRTFFDFDFDFSKLAPRAGFSPFFAEVDFQCASKSNFFSTLKLHFHPNDRKMQISVCV